MQRHVVLHAFQRCGYLTFPTYSKLLYTLDVNFTNNRYFILCFECYFDTYKTNNKKMNFCQAFGDYEVLDISFGIYIANIWKRFTRDLASPTRIPDSELRYI